MSEAGSSEQQGEDGKRRDEAAPLVQQSRGVRRRCPSSGPPEETGPTCPTKRVRLRTKTPPNLTSYAGSGPGTAVAAAPATAVEPRRPARSIRNMSSIRADPLARPQPRGDGGTGHSIIVSGRLAWCQKCGLHAERRLGSGLSKRCPERPAPGADVRLARLREGRHPITGERLVL